MSSRSRVRRWIGSLRFRFAALFLLGLFALQAAILVIALWPDGRPLMFRLIDPQDAREIAEAIESAPPSLRPAIAAAASTAGTTVEIMDGFPVEDASPSAPAVRPAPHLEERFRRFAEELQGRPLHVQTRDGTIFSRPLRKGDPPRGPVRVLIGLETGEVVAIERAPLLLQILAERYVVVAAVGAAVLLSILFMLSRQILRPVEHLAKATQAFERDASVPDVKPSGARELRALAAAFNSMKGRIGGLIGERTHMLAAIAHDLRTYLTRLRLRAEQIGDERHRARAIDDIQEMGQLLDDILLFAQSDADRTDMAVTIDARREAADYVALRQEAGDPVAISTPTMPVPCSIAPLAFRRIMGNLIDNAIRYGTYARATLRQEDGGVILEVIDNGPGIPAELLERLTAPFERLESSRTRSAGGAGLGLSIVKALAEAHGGSLTLGNRDTGGLRATVRLPAPPTT